MADRGLMQIGEVADRSGLSLRTIRYYEEVGLAAPSARSQGGFRLYTDADLQRLQLVRRMKPLELTLEQMRELLDILDRLTTQPGPTRDERARLLAGLRRYREAIRARCVALREQLAAAEAFDTGLAGHLDVREPEPVGAPSR
jgi:DNA-binding transcriptional MerR regulator